MGVTLPITTIYVISLDHPLKGVVGKQTEFVSQLIQNEPLHSSFFLRIPNFF